MRPYPKNAVLSIQYRVVDTAAMHGYSAQPIIAEIDKVFRMYSMSEQDFIVLHGDSGIFRPITDSIYVRIEGIRLIDIDSQRVSLPKRMDNFEKDMKDASVADAAKEATLVAWTSAMSFMSPVGGVIAYGRINEQKRRAFAKHSCMATCTLTFGHLRKKYVRPIVKERWVIRCPFVEVTSYEDQLNLLKDEMINVLKKRIVFIGAKD